MVLKSQGLDEGLASYVAPKEQKQILRYAQDDKSLRDFEKTRYGSVTAFFADFYVQALDLLVERAERDVELLGGVGLVPVAAFEFLNDDAALDVFEDVEERGV